MGLACAPSDPGPTARERDQARAAGQWVSAAIAERAHQPVCGTESPAPGALPDLAMLVTVPQALSCRDLGFALRRLPGKAERTWVVVPLADTADLCPFLRTERVRLPVMGVPDPSRRLSATRLVVAVRRERGTPDRHLYGARGADLLRQLAPKAGIQSDAGP